MPRRSDIASGFWARMPRTLRPRSSTRSIIAGLLERRHGDVDDLDRGIVEHLIQGAINFGNAG